MAQVTNMLLPLVLSFLNVLLLGMGEELNSCLKVLNTSDFPCKCSIDSDRIIEMNCDNIVFQGEVPLLPFRLPLHSFSQRNVGYQSLGSQLFTASGIPLQHLDFSHNHLLRLTDKIFDGLEESLQELNLGHNHLGDQLNPIFSTNEFHGLKNLQILDLSFNQLKGLDDGIFQGLTGLQEVHLQGNDLEGIPSQSLKYVTSLEELFLQDNIISMILKNAFAPLQNLTLLNLTNNYISKIQPGAFNGLQELKHLLLASNQLKNFQAGSLDGLEAVETLDLSYNFLTEFPNKELAKLRSLRSLLLQSNHIQNLKLDAFTELINLEFLDLTRNQIKDIPSSLFSSMKSLRELHLDVNLYRKLEDDAFDGLDNLEVLTMDDNALLAVPTAALARLLQLRMLSMNYNRIAVISNSILQGTRHLEDLSLQFNLIREIPENTFINHKVLQMLDLHGNLIDKISPTDFAGIENQLIHLDLGRNRISEIFPLKFPILEILILDHNNLTFFKEDTFSLCTQLETLDLHSNNIITILPKTFSNLKMLQRLNLQNNHISEITPGLFYHLNVFILNLHNNKLKEIPEHAFYNLSQINILDLSENAISNIRKGAFDGISTLKSLNLSNNRLTTFKGDFFRSLTFLEILDLSFNQITYLYPDSFTMHPKLQILDLSNNQLSFFPAEIIRDVNSLLKIDLHGNSLHEIDDVDFGGMPNLRHLDLSNNALNRLSDAAFQNSSQLQFLNLSNNSIVALPEKLFRGLNRLILDISSNNLSSLPPDIFNRPFISRLESIDLSNNQFTEVPLTALQKQYFFLENLNLSGNKIRNIPPNANILVNIKKLDLSYNPLSPASINTIFSEPKTARALNLAGTGISRMSTLETPFLQELNLTGNNITLLSGEIFQRATMLKLLDLSHNDIPNLNLGLSNAWSKIANLRFLDLSHNPIQHIVAKDFQGLKKLNYLNLNNLDALGRFESEALKDLIQLQHLKIANYPHLYFLDLKNIIINVPPLQSLMVEIKDQNLQNQLNAAYSSRFKEITVTGGNLKSASSSSFAGLTNPHLTIALQNTSLSQISSSVFLPLPVSSEIIMNIGQNKFHTLTPQIMNFLDERQEHVRLTNLKDNPLICDCNMRPMWRWIREKLKRGATDFENFAELTCYDPPSLRGSFIIELQEIQLICDNRLTTTTTTTPPSTTEEITTTREIEILYQPQTTPMSVATKENMETRGSLNNMDSMIIGIIVGVVAFVCILIIIICVIKLRRTQRHYPHEGAPGALAFRMPNQCTCVKTGPPLCQCMANYPPHPIHSGSPTSKILPPTPRTLSRNGVYPNPPYYVTYPESEHEHR